MNPRRSAKVAAALCGTVALAGWVVAWLAGFGSAGIENTGAVQDRRNRAQALTYPFAGGAHGRLIGDIQGNIFELKM